MGRNSDYLEWSQEYEEELEKAKRLVAQDEENKREIEAMRAARNYRFWKENLSND